MPRVFTKGPRTGAGAIVPRELERQKARIEFFQAFWELEPQAQEELWSEGLVGMAPGSVLDEESVHDHVIRQWQEKHGLQDEWVRDFVMLGLKPIDLNEGREVHDESNPYLLNIGPRVGTAYGRHGYPIALDDLHVYGEWDDGTPIDVEDDLIGVFDPRTETPKEAFDRIKRELERRLHHALEITEQDDAALGDNVPAQNLPPRQDFEWTVRYQVRGENYSDIVKSDDVELKTVSKAVKRVASLVDLTLRDSDKGGAPKKLKRRTVIYRPR